MKDSVQMPDNIPMPKEGWADRLIESARGDKAKQDALNERHDKIISELEAVDRDWWLNYPTARSIMVCRLQLARTDEGSEELRLHNCMLNLKRNTVASYIVPAMNACIRAGFVKAPE